MTSGIAECGRKGRSSGSRAIGVLAAFAAAGILLAGCSEPSQQTGPRSAEGLPASSFKDLILRETTEGKLEWILRAEQAWRENPNAPTRLARLRVDFYQRTDQIRSTLTADSGRVDGQKGTLWANGNVVVVTTEGNQLQTEELFWDRKNGQVVSDVAVRFLRGEDVLTGIGFRSDPNLEHYEILRDVRASVRQQGEIRDEFLDPDSAGVAR
jgi:LPS export ABC transporter protein LptC